MTTKILIPTPLRPYTDEKDAVDAEGKTVGELLADLTSRHSGLKPHLYNQQGRLRSFVNVYVNDEDIRYLQKEQTPVSPGDTISIIPSVAGGVETGSGVVSTGAVAETTPAPVSTPALDNDEIKRYSRHLIMPEVGVDGQRKLKAAKVLCIGAGGLGSPAALYLAAAGVGTIGLVDFDVVDLSNLQRQILHTTARVGERKVESARIAINALNPDINVVEHEEMLVADNVARLIDGYDVILDGTDTFETRYILNDAAVAAGIPVVHASVFRFEGQLTTFVPYEGPCYRCLYPTPPPPELAPGCSVAGVLGVVPGILGLLQANEVLKLLLGIGTTLAGRLLLFDALETEFTELTLRRDPACPVCSDAAVEARKAGCPLSVATVGGDAPFLMTTTGLAGSVSPE